ncbi:MAG: FixH family protein [Solirubrobacterales bacterium]
MKKRIIKSLIVSLIFVLGLSTMVLADEMNMDKGVEKKVDGISIAMSFKDNKAKTGDNEIMVTLNDSNGQPISNASVTASAVMDKNMDMNMDKSKPVAIDFEKGDANGQYMGKVNFTDKGKWIVKVTADVQGQQKEMDFNADVVDAGPNMMIIGGFTGVIALIIVLAAIGKKKSVKA